MLQGSNNSSSITIAVDAMGGDFGSAVVVRGALRSLAFGNHRIVLIGNSAEIEEVAVAEPNVDPSRYSIEHAPEVIGMHDSPSKALRGKSVSSIKKSFELVSENRAQAVISTGNTGAFMAAGVFVLGTVHGIARPAIATLLPRSRDRLPLVLLDSGANIDCNASQLFQFALMGSHYARHVLGIENPRVALISNGSESSKGNDTLRSAALLLRQSSQVNYVGYVEGRDFSGDSMDVVVCDGFVGNVVLKTMEGTARFVTDSIKEQLSKSVRGKLGLALVAPLLRKLFRERLDPAAYGGAPLLGLRGVAIVCHGSSNERAISNAVRVAERIVQGDVVGKISLALDGGSPTALVSEDINGGNNETV